MGISKQKKAISERGSIENHVFHGSTTGLEIFNSMGDTVLVYFDPDVDGVIAGLLVCKYLVLKGKKFQWYINSNRSHDWSIPIEKVSGKDVIAVDFLISAEKVIEICDSGANLISMDHHENRDKLISYESDYGTRGVVINNQYPFGAENSRYLSGAGVVFETLISWDKAFDTEENRQLVGITLLSDIRDIENPLAEGYLYQLYSAKYKGYLKYLIDNTMGDRDYGFGLPKMDRSYVDYKFSPAINAALRFNRQEYVVNFMLGRCPLDLGYRALQKQLAAKIESGIKVVEFSHLRVCYFKDEEFSDYEKSILSSFVGLVASDYLDGEKSVICYMISGRSVRRASFRGRVNGLRYRDACLGLLDGRGHGSAFGIIGLKPNKELFLKINEICGSLEENEGYSRAIENVVNMSFFVGGGRAFSIAEDNMYKLSQNQVFVRYKGSGIVVKKRSANYTEYELDGIPVMYFGVDDLTIMGKELPLIAPTLERGIVKFYFN